MKKLSLLLTCCVLVGLVTLVSARVAPPGYRETEYDDNNHPDAPYQSEHYKYSESVEDVAYTGLAEEMGSALGGAVFGVIIFALSFVVLFWNEGRALRSQNTLAAARRALRLVDSKVVEGSNEGALIHVAGGVQSQDTLRDADFGLEVKGALRLKRSVEMFQWIQTTRTTETKQYGGGKEKRTRYDYSEKWSSTIHDSSSYRNPPIPQNPAAPAIGAADDSATNVKLGAFCLSKAQIARLGRAQPVAITEENIEAYRRRGDAGCVIQRTSTPGEVYIGGPYTKGDWKLPQIGDTRVKFTKNVCDSATVVAQQQGDSFTACRFRSGTIDIARDGEHSADEVFASEAATGTCMTWLVRVIGFVMMSAGMSAVGGPLVSLADIIPVVGTLLQFAIGWGAFLLAIPLTLLTIAIAWFFYRPVHALVLLALTAGVLYAMQSNQQVLRQAADHGAFFK